MDYVGGGLLLAAPVITRLNWWTLMPERVFRYVLAGTAAALTGKRIDMIPPSSCSLV